jgi:hypothetical protein
MRNLRVGGLVLGAFLLVALPASAAGRFHGGVVVGPAFGYYGWHNPYFYAPYGWYGPFGPYGPYGLYGSYPMNSNVGELKLKTNVKDADVYINGAYAGKAEKLKTMWLRPDSYTVEIRAAGYTSYAQRIYLIRGKTTQVKADLVAAPAS